MAPAPTDRHEAKVFLFQVEPLGEVCTRVEHDDARVTITMSWPGACREAHPAAVGIVLAQLQKYISTHCWRSILRATFGDEQE